MNGLVNVSDLFDITYGNSLELIHLEQCKSIDFDAIPFVSRTEKNNGVSAFVYSVMDMEPNPAHTLSVAASGSVLSTFYQPLPYYTGFHVLVLSPFSQMNMIEMLFYARCISSNRYKYNYGRQANKTLKDVLIPKKISPELLGRLSNYKSAIEQCFTKNILPNQTIKINSSNWVSFLISDLFEITGTKTTPLLELEEYGEGKYPYVRTKSTNNGVEKFYNYYTEEGNILTVDSAVIGYCSYQPLSFSASDHVEKLIPKNFKMNPYIALFLVKILNCEQYRYNYGLKASQTRLKKSTIKLPATKEGQPDWLFMENFIKSLPYSYAIG
jgi:hypothetical protein